MKASCIGRASDAAQLLCRKGGRIHGNDPYYLHARQSGQDDCLTHRIDYSKNPDKTQGGELISAYECDPKTADAEFLFSKRQYQTVSGREQRHDVIAYQVRQSFKPGEITRRTRTA